MVLTINTPTQLGWATAPKWKINKSTTILPKKKILVLGATGFVGKNLVRLLDKNKYNICAVGSHECDLRDKPQVECLYNITKPDIIINLAAVVGGIWANKEQPGRFFHDNMLINLNVIDATNDYDGSVKLVQLGSTCSFGKNCSIPFKEEYLFTEYPEQTNSAYGIAKLATLTMLQAYRQQYNLHGIYLIPTNMYGKYQDDDLKTSHVIPALIRKVHTAKLENKNLLSVWGTGNATRDFLYVDDCAQAIIMSMENYDKPEPVNIGSGKEISINELVMNICNIMDYTGNIVFDRSKPDGQPRRCLDISRAKEEFGWKPTTTLHDGLVKTINWYLQQKKKE